MPKVHLLTFLVLVSFGVSSLAADTASGTNQKDELSTEGWDTPPNLAPYDEAADDLWLFNGKELHVELSWVTIDDKGGDGEEADGFSIGGHYYLNRIISVGAEYAHVSNFDAENILLATVRVRIPLDDLAMSLVVLVGGGGTFGGDRTGGLFEAGAGVEIRMTESVSLTADWRYLIGSSDAEYQLYRVGLSFIF